MTTHKIFSGLSAVAVAFALTACGPSLDDRVRMAADHCPVTIDNVGFINDIRLSGDTLVYDCTVTNPDIDISALSKRPDEVKRVLSPQIANLFDNNSELLGQIMENDLTLSVRYRGRDGSALNVDFAPGELSGATNGEQSSVTADPVQRLNDEIEISRASLPVDMTEGITMTGIDDTDMMVTFRCSVDEGIAGADAMDNLRANRADIRAMMLSALRSDTDTDIRRLVEIATAANRGIAYSYTGNASGDTMEIRFTPQELIDKR